MTGQMGVLRLGAAVTHAWWEAVAIASALAAGFLVALMVGTSGWPAVSGPPTWPAPVADHHQLVPSPTPLPVPGVAPVQVLRGHP